VWRKATLKHTHQEETNQSEFIIVFSLISVLIHIKCKALN